MRSRRETGKWRRKVLKRLNTRQHGPGGLEAPICGALERSPSSRGPSAWTVFIQRGASVLHVSIASPVQAQTPR